MTPRLIFSSLALPRDDSSGRKLKARGNLAKAHKARAKPPEVLDGYLLDVQGCKPPTFWRAPLKEPQGHHRNKPTPDPQSEAQGHGT
jgi:hypothetical protein